MSTTDTSRLTILHVGAEARAHTVNGISNALWTMAVHQRRLGHTVQVLINQDADEAIRTRAAGSGLKLVRMPASYRRTWRLLKQLFEVSPPDVVHMHSVFAPDHAVIAAFLRARAVPYIVKIGGGLAQHVLLRGRLKKAVYSTLFERPRLNGAAGIAVVRPSEEAEVRSFLPRYSGLLRWIPNPVETECLTGGWRPSGNANTVVYLGRFDVMQKGLDRVAGIAALLPDVTFNLHGVASRRDEDGLRRLQQACPENVTFRPAVYDGAKTKVLTESTMYIQMSRSEGFANSIAEAMYLGLPCAVAETTNMAGLFAEGDLGCVLPSDPSRAAEKLKQALHDRAALSKWSERSRAFARENFDPERVAAKYIGFYRDTIQAAAPGRAADRKAAGAV